MKEVPTASEPRLNGTLVEVESFRRFHRKRFLLTLNKLREIGARRILEVGGHPWVMTAEIAADPRFDLRATVSAEEVLSWPDDPAVSKRWHCLKLPGGGEVRFPNYSANVERRLFSVQEEVDTVVACEIIEHLLRSPHIMLLNANRWLPLSGKLLLTTPNGSQFCNPFRRRSLTPSYRANVYERHSYLFTLEDLTDLVSLCGFQVVEAGYWDAYDRQGWSRIYGLLSRLPLDYCREKFRKTLFVVAVKSRDVSRLERLPRVYHPSGKWELIGDEVQVKSLEEGTILQQERACR